MKNIVLIVVAVAAIASLEVSQSIPVSKLTEAIRQRYESEMIALCEVYDSTRPQQMKLEKAYEASHKRIKADELALHE